MADVKTFLPVEDASDGTDGTTAPSTTIQIGGKDGSGNLQTIATDTSGRVSVDNYDSNGNVINTSGGQVKTTDILSVAGQSKQQSVTTTAIMAIGGSSVLAARKLLTICPTNGTVYWGYSSGITTASATPIFMNQVLALSVSDNLPVYVIAAAAVNCVISEAS